MAEDLSLSTVELGWVVNAFLVAAAALVLVGGRLGDTIGRVRTFDVGVAIFAVVVPGRNRRPGLRDARRRPRRSGCGRGVDPAEQHRGDRGVLPPGSGVRRVPLARTRLRGVVRTRTAAGRHAHRPAVLAVDLRDRRSPGRGRGDHRMAPGQPSRVRRAPSHPGHVGRSARRRAHRAGGAAVRTTRCVGVPLGRVRRHAGRVHRAGPDAVASRGAHGAPAAAPRGHRGPPGAGSEPGDRRRVDRHAEPAVLLQPVRAVGGDVRPRRVVGVGSVGALPGLDGAAARWRRTGWVTGGVTGGRSPSAWC